MMLVQGHALYLLSLSRPEFATEAVENLTSAAAGYGKEYQRSRTMILPPLTSMQFQAGDTTAAVRTGYYARLRGLDVVATPHLGRPKVADLREHLRRALPTSAASAAERGVIALCG